MGFGDETLEEGFGGGADVVAALRVPLDSEDEVVGVRVGGLAAFYGFDDGILGAAGGYAEVVAGDSDGLVVAGVDGEAEESVLIGGFFGGDDGAEEGVRGYGGGVGYGYGLSGGMVHGHGGEVLDKGSSAPDIEGLDTEADGEDGLVEVMGVLDEEFVDVFAGGIGGGALGDGFLAVLVGVDVGGAAGEEDGLAGVDEVCGLAGGGVEGDFDGLAAGFGDGFGVLVPGVPVVFGVGAGRDGNGYAGLHDHHDDTADDERLNTDLHAIETESGIGNDRMFHVEHVEILSGDRC